MLDLRLYVTEVIKKKLLANQDLSSKYGYMKERLTDLTASVFSFSRDLNVILSVGISFLRASQWQTHSFNTIEDKNGSLQIMRLWPRNTCGINKFVIPEPLVKG